MYVIFALKLSKNTGLAQQNSVGRVSRNTQLCLRLSAVRTIIACLKCYYLTKFYYSITLYFYMHTCSAFKLP